MKTFKNTLAVAAIAAFAMQAHAALQVDFGETAAPASETEAGYDAFAVTNNYTSPIAASFSGTGIDNGTDISITLTDNATATNARRMVDRGTTGWTGGLDALLRDWVGIDNRPGTTGSNDTLTVTIENLAAGTQYVVRSYHTDISTGGNQSAPMDIFINGGLRKDNFQGLSQVGSPSTATPNFVEMTTVSSSLSIDYVVQSTGGNSAFTVLNGIEIFQQQYAIDIDSTTQDNGVGISTADGFVSLDATEPSEGASVTVGGIDFSVGSTDGSRLRNSGGSPDPNALTADFVFDDGPGEAVIFFIGGAGDLPSGNWLVEMWMHEESGGIGDMIVGYRTNNVETALATDVTGDPTNPAFTFTLNSDGISAYDLFVRENNSNNRSRLNAVRLTYLVPAPAALPAGLAMIGLLAARRRRK